MLLFTLFTSVLIAAVTISLAFYRKRKGEQEAFVRVIAVGFGLVLALVLSVGIFFVSSFK